MGRWWGKKYHELPRQRSKLQNLSDVTILQLCSLSKARNFQRKPGTVTCSYLQWISALSTVAAAHPPPSARWQAAVLVFLEQLARSLLEPEWAKRTLSSKYQGSVFWLLTATSDLRGVDQEEGEPFLLSPFTSLLSWKWISGYLKDQYPSLLIIFLFFPFWEPGMKDQDIQKQLHIQRKLESDHMCPGQSPDSEKIWEDLRFPL